MTPPIISSRGKKFLSGAMVLFFLFEQSAWPVTEMVRLNDYEQPVTSAAEYSEDSSAAAGQEKNIATAIDFLQQSRALTSITVPEKEKSEEEKLQENRSYGRERSSMEEAMDLLRPEYAAAVIVDKVSAEDLRRLQELSFETALVVLDGEIVLFSTGNESEIGSSSYASELLKKAAFVSHVHPQNTEQEGPSAFDLNHAVEAPDVEYVITSAGAYAYNKQGLQNKGEALSFQEISDLIEAARIQARRDGSSDQIAARSDLNEFIREMDSYNEMLEGRETFRRGGPVAISTLQQLADIQSDLNGEYYLTNDIDASAAALWNSGAGFQPIGTGAGGFQGIFDGKGFKITNLSINRPNQDYVGLFSSLAESASVKNVSLENAAITGRHNVGAVSGYMFLSTVLNVSAEGGTVTGIDRVGGLIGESYNGLGIRNSHSNISVAGNDQAGGIVGKIWDGNENNVAQSYALGTVTGRNQVGGLAGYSKSGDFIRSYASGNVTGQDYVGGLVGLTTENAGIKNSYYAGGVVTGTGNNVGGIAGLYGSYDDGIYNTYFSGSVTSSGSEGGFIGAYSAGILSNNFWDSTLNPGLQDSGSSDLTGVTGLSTAAMQTESTYEGWDFSYVWTLDGYPKLRQYTAISTLEELRDIKNNLNGKYYLLNDINASETASWNGGAGFEPVGAPGSAFTGVFDGYGYKITGLSINRPNQDYVGLFGFLGEPANLVRLKLENISITGRNNVGAITGYMFLTEITGSSAEGGTVTGNNHVGGLIGESYNGNGIKDSHSNVMVSGNDLVGGIVGKLWDGNRNDLTRTYALGTVSGRNLVGGLAGYSKSGDLILSYATGNVTGQDAVGGLVGQTTENAGIKNSYYAAGTVTGTGNNVGGIAGYYGSYDDGISNTYFAGRVISSAPAGGFLGTYSAGVISNNYWDTTLNPGLQDSVNLGDMNGITGLNTSAMQTQSSFNSWDFSQIWIMDGYPRFRTSQDPAMQPYSVTVQTRDGYVNTPYVPVTFTAPQGTTEMRYGFANGNGPAQLGGWGGYTPLTSVFIHTANVGGQDGPKVFYAQYRDAAGVESEIVSFPFIADTLAPSGTVKIANGRSDTNGHEAAISLTGQDVVSGVADMRVSVDGGVIWTPWDTFSGTAQVRFPRGEGDKEVLVELRDHAGNKSRISDIILVQEDLDADIIADASAAFTWAFHGDASGSRTGDSYVISGNNMIESGTGFQFQPGLDMKGRNLALHFNVTEGSGTARIELKTQQPDGSFLFPMGYSPIKFEAGLGEQELVLRVPNVPQLSDIDELILVIEGAGGPFRMEITDFDLLDAGYEAPPVSNGDFLTNSAQAFTVLNKDDYPSHNGEFYPENWGMTETGAYHFSGIQQGGTETKFFQNLDRPLDAAGKTFRIVYESSTGAPDVRMKLRNAKNHPSVHEYTMFPVFEATAEGERKILEFQIPNDANWSEIDEFTIYTHGEGAIDLTFHEIRLVDSTLPELNDPLSQIIDQDPGKIFLSPESFAERNPDKTILDVLRNGQNQIVRIETRGDIFGYFYDAQGQLIKTVQAAKEGDEIIEETEYLYTYETVNNVNRLKEVREYLYVTRRTNAAPSAALQVSSSLNPNNAPQSPFPASYVNDGSGGNTGRPWIAALNDANPTLNLDLGTFRNIDEIQFDGRFFGGMTSIIYPTHFELSGSLDGVQWFDLAVYDSAEFQEGYNKVYKFEFETAQVRYVRVSDIHSVIPYWVGDPQNYPELNGFPVTSITAYVSELSVFETRRVPELTHVYRPEYGCAYACENFTGREDARIRKNALTEEGEASAPVVSLLSSAVTHDATFFLEFLEDGKIVRRPVTGPFVPGNNLRVYTFENAEGSQTLVPVNVIYQNDLTLDIIGGAARAFSWNVQTSGRKADMYFINEGVYPQPGTVGGTAFQYDAPVNISGANLVIRYSNLSGPSDLVIEFKKPGANPDRYEQPVHFEQTGGQVREISIPLPDMEFLNRISEIVFLHDSGIQLSLYDFDITGDVNPVDAAFLRDMVFESVPAPFSFTWAPPAAPVTGTRTGDEYAIETLNGAAHNFESAHVFFADPAFDFTGKNIRIHYRSNFDLEAALEYKSASSEPSFISPLHIENTDKGEIIIGAPPFAAREFLLKIPAINQAVLAGDLVFSDIDVIEDHVVPSGILLIENGANYANHYGLSLSFGASEYIKDFQYSVDGGAWSDWQNYSEPAVVNVAQGEGQRGIRVKLRDYAGNLSAELSDSIIIDTTPPGGQVFLNNGDTYTNHTENNQIKLQLTDDGSGISVFRYREVGGEWSDWINYASLVNGVYNEVTLTGGEGVRSVEVEVVDNSQNHRVFNQQLIMDNVRPSRRSISINNSSPFTNNPVLNLTLTAEDEGSGVDSLRLSTDGGATWSPNWTTFQSACSSLVVNGSVTTCETTLNVSSLPDGEVRVFYQIRDAAGNVRDVDTFPISLSGFQNGNFILNIQDPLGALKYDIQYTTNLGMSWQTALTNVPVSGTGITTVSVPPPPGPFAFFRAVVVEQFGDVYTQSIILDRVLPTAALASYSAGNPTLNQTYRDTRFNLTGVGDALSGLKQVRYRIDSGSWTTAALPSGSNYSVDIRLPEGWGARNVQIQLEDFAGNIRTIQQTVTIEVAAYLADVDFKYFLNPYDAAHGAFEITHSYPHEGYDLRNYTQPTHFGFTAQLLANVIAGRIVVDYMTRAQAISILKTMITNLLNDQTNSKIGVMGLLPWMNFNSSTQDWDRDFNFGSGVYSENGRKFMLGDNSNLAVAFATALGALTGVADNPAGDLAVIRTKLQTFLANQAVGFQCLASTGSGNPTGSIRRGIIISEAKAAAQTPVTTCADVTGGGNTVAFVNDADTKNPDTSRPVAFEQYFGSEFRAGILFVVLNYLSNEAVYKNLKVEIENYIKADGTTVYTVSPGDGGAFQMLWPALTTPEAGNAALLRMQQNFLNVALDFAARNNQKGFLSAAYGPSQYEKKIGIAQIAHNNTERIETLPSVYTLGAAYGIDPARMRPFLQSMVQNVPSLITGHGLWEGVDMTTNSVITRQVSSNVATFILGILNTGGNDLRAYLTAAQETRLDTLLWPVPGADVDTVSSSTNAFSWPITDPAPVQTAPVSGSKSSDTYNISTSSLKHVGTALQLNDTNISGKRLFIRYHAATNSTGDTVGNMKIEFKDAAGNIRAQVNQVVLKKTGANTEDVMIDLPAFAGGSQIREIVFVITGSGNSANITFDDVDLIALTSVTPLNPSGGGGGGARAGVSTADLIKSQTYALLSYTAFLSKAKSTASAEITATEKKILDLKNSGRNDRAAKEEMKQLKAALSQYESVFKDISQLETQVGKHQKTLSQGKPVKQNLLDEMLVRFGGIYDFLYS